MDIKEIATRLEPQYWHRDRGIGEFFDTCGFAEALVAEIQRQSESVGTVKRRQRRCNDGDTVSVMDVAWKQYPKDGELLYTFPPSIEALEDKVAEACAEWLDWYDGKGGRRAEAIRSGEWKKFRKGK